MKKATKPLPEPLPLKYSVPLDEQETVIQIDRKGKAHIYTTDTTWMTKLDKKYHRIKEDTFGGKAIAVYYDVPRDDVKVAPKRRVSDKARKLSSERMKAMMSHK